MVFYGPWFPARHARLRLAKLACDSEVCMGATLAPSTWPQLWISNVAFNLGRSWENPENAWENGDLVTVYITMENQSPFFVGKLTIPMAILNSYVTNYQGVDVKSWIPVSEIT